jgi:hypothetical protein
MYLVPNLGISLLLRGQRIKEPPVGYEPTTSYLQKRITYQLSYRGLHHFMQMIALKPYLDEVPSMTEIPCVLIKLKLSIGVGELVFVHSVYQCKLAASVFVAGLVIWLVAIKVACTTGKLNFLLQ